MTSNGNTAQKHLIKILTETHQEPQNGIQTSNRNRTEQGNGGNDKANL